MSKTTYIIGCLLLYSCITRYEATGIDNLEKILVVDGFITDSVTIIVLSRSVGLDGYIGDSAYISNAVLQVECSDGSLSPVSRFVGKGTYAISTGKLRPDIQYRLKINLDGEEYQSEYLSPLFTPEFDLRWVKEDNWSRISFQISTQDNMNQSPYYLWSYKEDWECTAKVLVDSFCINYEWVFNDVSLPGNNYYCWKKDSSRTFIMKTVEQLTENRIINHEIHSLNAASEQLSLLYHIEVRQNQIRKEAYTYYNNLRKNVEQTGDIFTPIPAEIPGNLYCFTSPHLPVIGYVEVSTTSRKKQFITAADEAYNVSNIDFDFYRDCDPWTLYSIPPPECFNNDVFQWVHYDKKNWYYYRHCIDCLAAGGTKNKPKWWPTDHL